MSLHPSLVLAASLTVTAALAGAQQQQPAHQSSTKSTKPAASAPAITADSAKSIALAHVKNGTVKSEQLHTRNGHKYYLITLHEAGHKGEIRTTVDASSGAFTRLDQTAHSGTTPPSGAGHSAKP